jgi:hypothetical protein
MTREEQIEKIKLHSPKILQISMTEMGYEFDAIHSDGIIFAEPGMLLNLSGGNLTKKMLKNPSKLIDDVTKSGGAEITKYTEVSDEILLRISTFLTD